MSLASTFRDSFNTAATGTGGTSGVEKAAKAVTDFITGIPKAAQDIVTGTASNLLVILNNKVSGFIPKAGSLILNNTYGMIPNILINGYGTAIKGVLDPFREGYKGALSGITKGAKQGHSLGKKFLFNIPWVSEAPGFALGAVFGMGRGLGEGARGTLKGLGMGTKKALRDAPKNVMDNAADMRKARLAMNNAIDNTTTIRPLAHTWKMIQNMFINTAPIAFGFGNHGVLHGLRSKIKLPSFLRKGSQSSTTSHARPATSHLAPATHLAPAHTEPAPTEPAH